MKNARNLVLISLLSLIASCKPPYPAPATEVCIHSEGNYGLCTDLRVSKEPYENNNLTNYICTNPADYDKLYSYTADLRQKLIECEARVK